jgi:hypothetical protein
MRTDREAVIQWKGVVHGNVVVLDEGGQLPDGVRVTITLDQTEVIRAEAVTPDDLEQRRTWTAQMRATLARAIVCQLLPALDAGYGVGGFKPNLRRV